MSQTFNNDIQALRRQFIDGLPQKAHQLENVWHHLRHVKWSEQGLRTLHTLVHRLVGSGTSFGQPDISANAQILDIYLQDNLHDNYLHDNQELGQSFGSIEREIIDQMVKSLVRTLNNCDVSKVIPATLNSTIAGAGKDIFVVDADRTLSALIATYLCANGFNVQLFDTPTACIQQLQVKSPHAILMDVGFQGESLQELEAIEHIKIRLGNSVPIVLISTRTDMHARLRALRAGCANYLTKPIDFLRLVNTLSMTIDSYETTHRVMIVDDHESVAHYHAEILRHAGMETIYITQPLQSLQRAKEFKPDLVILDMHMPGINGIELATLLRQEEQFLVLPIIFVTSDKSQSLRDSLESLGVNGVLTKPVNVENLIATIKRAINETVALLNRISRVTQRGTYRQQITRSYFFNTIDNELQQPFREKPIALYYIGLDAIENLYGQYGQTGIASLHEQFIQLVAPIINADEQWTDISNLVVCVLTGERSKEQHLQRTAQIITHLHSLTYELLGKKLTLKVSIGVSYLDTEQGSANTVLLHAEQAYDAACLQGGDSTMEYEIQNKTLINSAESDEPDIHFKKSLPTDSLSISYQPMISLEEQNIEHYEALIRWRTETAELIPAAKFLHYIEHSSMRIELDRWVLKTAVDAVMNNRSTRENANLFVHLSEETLQQKSFFSFAANVLQSSRLHGERRVVFMIGEHWLNVNGEQGAIIIHALRDMRCGICLIQAGSTNQSERFIGSFNFDYIKLAPHLTTHLDTNSEAMAALKKITKIAKAAGSQIIATQVEDSRNLSTLWIQGVRLFQGFFIQSPEQEFNTSTNLEFYEADHKKF